MNLSNDFLKAEKELKNKGFGRIIGVDEAGRGPLCGPVVAAAVCLRTDLDDLSEEFLMDENWNLVRDSKKLSEKQREKVFSFIWENFQVGIGICDHQTIDRINILEASFLAMKKAINDLERKTRNTERETHSPKGKVNCLNDSHCISNSFAPRSTLHAPRLIILVDGNKKIPNFSAEQLAIVGGDKKIKSISAASIVAKVTRDRMMEEFDQKYPGYGFAKHKGYGTKAHLEALEKFGPCEIHRQSFGPVKKWKRA